MAIAGVIYQLLGMVTKWNVLPQERSEEASVAQASVVPATAANAWVCPGASLSARVDNGGEPAANTCMIQCTLVRLWRLSVLPHRRFGHTGCPLRQLEFPSVPSPSFPQYARFDVLPPVFPSCLFCLLKFVSRPLTAPSPPPSPILRLQIHVPLPVLHCLPGVPSPSSRVPDWHSPMFLLAPHFACWPHLA